MYDHSAELTLLRGLTLEKLGNALTPDVPGTPMPSAATIGTDVGSARLGLAGQQAAQANMAVNGQAAATKTLKPRLGVTGAGRSVATYQASAPKPHKLIQPAQGKTVLASASFRKHAFQKIALLPPGTGGSVSPGTPLRQQVQQGQAESQAVRGAATAVGRGYQALDRAVTPYVQPVIDRTPIGGAANAIGAVARGDFAGAARAAGQGTFGMPAAANAGLNKAMNVNLGRGDTPAKLLEAATLGMPIGQMGRIGPGALNYGRGMLDAAARGAGSAGSRLLAAGDAAFARAFGNIATMASPRPAYAVAGAGERAVPSAAQPLEMAKVRARVSTPATPAPAAPAQPAAAQPVAAPAPPPTITPSGSVPPGVTPPPEAAKAKITLPKTLLKAREEFLKMDPRGPGTLGNDLGAMQNRLQQFYENSSRIGRTIRGWGSTLARPLVQQRMPNLAKPLPEDAGRLRQAGRFATENFIPTPSTAVGRPGLIPAVTGAGSTTGQAWATRAATAGVGAGAAYKYHNKQQAEQQAARRESVLTDARAADAARAARGAGLTW